MDLRHLFTSIESLDAEQARDYIAGHKEGTYMLLDVRQPGEYVREHLPGATLVPLAELSEAAREMEPEKPVIIY